MYLNYTSSTSYFFRFLSLNSAPSPSSPVPPPGAKLPSKLVEFYSSCCGCNGPYCTVMGCHQEVSFRKKPTKVDMGCKNFGPKNRTFFWRSSKGDFFFAFETIRKTWNSKPAKQLWKKNWCLCLINHCWCERFGSSSNWQPTISIRGCFGYQGPMIDFFLRGEPWGEPKKEPLGWCPLLGRGVWLFFKAVKLRRTWLVWCGTVLNARSYEILQRFFLAGSP